MTKEGAGVAMDGAGVARDGAGMTVEDWSGAKRCGGWRTYPLSS